MSGELKVQAEARSTQTPLDKDKGNPKGHIACTEGNPKGPERVGRVIPKVVLVLDMASRLVLLHYAMQVRGHTLWKVPERSTNSCRTTPLSGGSRGLLQIPTMTHQFSR